MLMGFNSPQCRLAALLLTGLLAAPCLAQSLSKDASFGRISGTVVDTEGNPLMGATVLLMGPMLSGSEALEAAAERIVTDGEGRFKAERLVPGWYSLRVTSPTRLPAVRNGVRVEAGQSALEKFVLSDLFAPLRVQAPAAVTSSWGDDWKWILRSSARTRPILRYEEVAKAAPASVKAPRPASQRLIGMIPGSTQRQALEGDPGLGSVLAYLRPLSNDADVLVTGSMTADGIQGSSVATAFRRNLMKGDPQELALAVHELAFSEALPLGGGDERDSMRRAQAVAISYAHTRRIFDALSMTAGFELDYLNAAMDVMAAHPRARLEYRLNSSTVFAVHYGAMSAEGEGTLLDRIGALNSFPRITLRGYRPKLEKLNHAEMSASRKLSRSAKVEVAAYQDDFENAALWGFGRPEALAWLAGDALPNPAAEGVTINAGNYRSSGLRASYALNFGKCVDAAFVYTTGHTLTASLGGAAAENAQGTLREALRADRSHSLGGKVSARIPVSHTAVSTSYEWLQRGRVTGLDPYGQASLQLGPFLDVQLRQPLPSLAFLPAHIEALADFRNLLAQGYVPVFRGGEQLLLTPAYRSFRGGFSVQF